MTIGYICPLEGEQNQVKISCGTGLYHNDMNKELFPKHKIILLKALFDTFIYYLEIDLLTSKLIVLSISGKNFDEESHPCAKNMKTSRHLTTSMSNSSYLNISAFEIDFHFWVYNHVIISYIRDLCFK